MTIPIYKHYQEMDGLMNIADAKDLFRASSKIQKFKNSSNTQVKVLAEKSLQASTTLSKQTLPKAVNSSFISAL